jgi:hypothetical protein
MAKEPLEAIELLADNEMVISRIYRVFAERFPEYRDFWETMAQEETRHADMILSDLFEADTEELALIFEGLVSSTREHHRRLVQTIEKSGWSPK